MLRWVLARPNRILLVLRIGSEWSPDAPSIENKGPALLHPCHASADPLNFAPDCQTAATEEKIHSPHD